MSRTTVEKQKRTKLIQAKITPDLWLELTDYVFENDIDLADVIRQAIKAYIKKSK